MDQNSIDQHGFEDVKNQFKKYEQMWRDGEICQFTNEHISKETSSFVTKVIGFGLGSPNLHYGSGVFSQYAAVLTITEALRIRNSSRIAVKSYCQDPLYSQTDEILLQQRGIDVLKNLMGFLEVDRESFIISIAPDVPVKQIIADDQEFWPAALLCFRISSIEEEKNACQLSNLM